MTRARTIILALTGTALAGQAAALYLPGSTRAATPPALGRTVEGAHSAIRSVARALPVGTDKIVHVGLFATATALPIAAGLPWWLVAGAQVAHAFASERAQSRIPGRGEDPADTRADLAGVALGALAGAGFARRIRR